MAPGIDIDRDILAHMDFEPLVSEPQPMDARIFAKELMGLREHMADIPFEERFSYDPKLRMLFIDLRQLAIRSEREVERIKAEVERRVRPLGHSLCDRQLSRMPGRPKRYRELSPDGPGMEQSCYLGVTRYGMSGLVPGPDIDCRVGTPDRAASGGTRRGNTRATRSWPLVEQVRGLEANQVTSAT